ncbi:hypothetical protein TNCV_5095591 [Trichonephila clavipes]|nr:hypothetical protein TNCV_5095591 [Trichonephila clavipes]
MATGSYMTPTYSRSQSEVQGDLHIVTSPICVLCDTGQDMTAAHLDECSALNDLNCIVAYVLLVHAKYKSFGQSVRKAHSVAFSSKSFSPNNRRESFSSEERVNLR